MRTRITTLVAGTCMALAAVGVVFVVGMRTKSPLVLDAVRRCGRATKRFVLPSAGTPGSAISVVGHIGRTSGRPYETPVQAVVTDDGFAVALPYGPNTDWLKNVLAIGSATITHGGTTHQVDQPVVIPMSVAAPHFSSNDQRTHRLFAVGDCLLVRRVASDETGQAADPA